MEHWRAWHKAACALPLPAGRRLAAYGSLLAMLLATVGVHYVHLALHRHDEHGNTCCPAPDQNPAHHSVIEAGAELAAQWRCPICTFLAKYRTNAPERQPHVEWGHRVVVAAPHEEHIVTIRAQRAPLGPRAPPRFIPAESL